MPLINFKTDFKSLRYGGDKPNGGSSTQPYVQFPIPDSYNSNLSDGANAIFNNYYETNRTSLDFPIRGGRVVEVAGNTYSTPSNDIDRIRIQNFLKDTRGNIFIQKQKNLQLTNPITQVPNTITTTNGILGLFGIDNRVIPVTQTYNPANTLAQVFVQGTGAHFNRQGLSPTLYESPQSTYAYITANTDNPSQNRLLLLSTTKLREQVGFLFGVQDVVSLRSINQLGIAASQGQILNYQGGPGSTYGVGSTIIKRATSTVPAKTYSATSFTYDQIANQKTTSGRNKWSPIVQDFRAQLPIGNIPRSNYEKNSLETKYNVGNPGANFKRVDYTGINSVTVDKLNAKSIFYYNAVDTDPWAAGGSDTKDLIKFAFECMDNNNPGFATALIFRAFIDGAIQDNNTAEYASFKYLGRGETFRTYQGFERNISFAFKILVQSRSEMKPLYAKLNHLISQIYPDYSPLQGFMRGAVVNLTIGDYLYRTPGFLESVNVTLNTDVGWEVVLNPNEGFDEEKGDAGVAQLPFVVNVSCTFKPIMNILPQRETKDVPYVPLIGNTQNDYTKTTIINTTNSADNQNEQTTTQQTVPDGFIRVYAGGIEEIISIDDYNANPNLYDRIY